MGVVVDPTVLARITGTLRAVSADVDAAGASAPPLPDAGIGTAATAGILALLTEAGGR